MLVVNLRTVELTDTEIDVVAYYERLLDEGKGIAVAAFWALRMAALADVVLTVEFALYLSENTLTLDGRRMPVINRFCGLGADVVAEHLADDPRIAAVTQRPRIAMDLDLAEQAIEHHSEGAAAALVDSLRPATMPSDMALAALREKLTGGRPTTIGANPFVPLVTSVPMPSEPAFPTACHNPEPVFPAR